MNSKKIAARIAKFDRRMKATEPSPEDQFTQTSAMTTRRGIVLSAILRYRESSMLHLRKGGQKSSKDNNGINH
jgi:hypothetical protein